MARAPLQKVQTGEKLHVKAGDWNAFIDAAVAEMNRRNSQKQLPHRKPASSGIVRVRNDSGADLDRFGVLGVSGVFYDASLNLDIFKFERVNLTGTTPAAADHRGKFVIALEPIPAGGIGFALASGVCQVKVNVTDEAHTYADVEDGSRARLASADQGTARFLWKEAGTGEKWAVVRLGALNIAAGFWARLTGHAEADSPAQNRWTYSWAEVEKTTAGYGGWTTKSGGRSGTNNAFNSIEDMNDGTALEGNGVDLDDVRWFYTQYLPAATGDVVWMEPVRVGAVTEYWFSYENEMIGEYDITCL